MAWPTFELARRQVEARTGAIANMSMFGFRPAKYAQTGEVTRWTTHRKGDGPLATGWIIQRTPHKQWRVIYLPGRLAYFKGGPENGVPCEVKLGGGITFRGPCEAAMWLIVERENGNGTR